MADMETLTEQDRYHVNAAKKWLDENRGAPFAYVLGNALDIIDRLTTPSSPAAPDAGEDVEVAGFHRLAQSIFPYCALEVAIIAKCLQEEMIYEKMQRVNLSGAQCVEFANKVLRKLRTPAPTPAEGRVVE